MSKEISSFHGEHRFLSNFWPANVVLDEVTYPSVEHAYVASKTLDSSVRALIREVASPGSVKRRGRAIVLRADWDEVRLGIMANLVWQKFQHPDLRQKLLDTGDAVLIEGNTWGDTFWGVCRGVGENHLGQILMGVRTGLLHAPAVAN